MTLRFRLLMVIVVLIVAYAITAFLVVSAQRDLLMDQIDDRLQSLPPFEMHVDVAAPPGPPVDTYSEIYIAAVDANQTTRPLVVGSMLRTPPDVLKAATASEGAPGLVTITGVDSTERFRALVSPRPAEGEVVVAALPLSEVDAAIDRLERTLLIGGVAILGVLTALYVWIQRLGLRPIERLTATAEAVATGDRTRRAAVDHPNTEAGKLGLAFNVMLDQLDQADARLRQFIADASHELRTPLTSIRGYLDLYRQGAFRQPAQLDDVVRRMSAESARMHDLVQDLLTLASLDEDRPLQPAEVDLGRLLRDAAQDSRAIQPGRPIAVDAPEAGPLLCGDEALLTQLVGILVANARTHTPIDTPIRLHARQDAQSAVISVTDAGPGLNAEAASHIFDRFWRGESSRQRHAQPSPAGAGLGLSIARSITEAHRGVIDLRTAPGEGCTFTVTLPVDAAPCPH